MQIKEHVRGLLRSIMFLCVGIQIVFGLIWTVANIATVSKFECSGLALEGIYNFIQSRLLLCILVYLVQLVLAYFSGKYMLEGLGVKGGYAVAGAIFLLTYQPALQCHLAVLPNSLLLSASMCLVGGVLRWWRKDSRKTWLISALLCVMGVFLVVMAQGSYTVKELSLKRFGWPVMIEDYSLYPEEFREAVDVDLLYQSMHYPDSIEKLFAQMEESFDKGKRERLYGVMLEITLDRHGSEILKRALWDGVGYHLPSLVLELQLKGRGSESLSGVNYGLFLGRTPLLSKYYVRFEALGSVLCLISAMGLWFISDKRKIPYKKFLLLGIGLELVVGYYWLLGAGRMDYKNGLIVSMVLLGLCIKVLSQGKEETEC